eukprot:GHVT01013931.1.p2 GENE.GHVT01013931.1~~GHVT01013931.1.p2  ORF type:complete len:126 (-),score=10.09 GHVT01013931.1:3094-3471(-)
MSLTRSSPGCHPVRTAAVLGSTNQPFRSASHADFLNKRPGVDLQSTWKARASEWKSRGDRHDNDVAAHRQRGSPSPTHRFLALLAWLRNHPCVASRPGLRARRHSICALVRQWLPRELRQHPAPP